MNFSLKIENFDHTCLSFVGVSIIVQWHSWAKKFLYGARASNIGVLRKESSPDCKPELWPTEPRVLGDGPGQCREMEWKARRMRCVFGASA